MIGVEADQKQQLRATLNQSERKVEQIQGRNKSQLNVGSKHHHNTFNSIDAIDPIVHNIDSPVIDSRSKINAQINAKEIEKQFQEYQDNTRSPIFGKDPTNLSKQQNQLTISQKDQELMKQFGGLSTTEDDVEGAIDESNKESDCVYPK